MKYKYLFYSLFLLTFFIGLVRTPLINAQQSIQTELEQLGSDALIRNWNYYQGSVFALGYINKEATFPGIPTWTQEVSSRQIGSSVIVSGIIYFGDKSNGALSAFDITTGSLLWKKPEVVYSGKTSMAHFNGKIFLSDSKKLYSVNPSNGDPFWTRDDLGPIASSPIVLNNTVIVGTADILWGLKVKDGTTSWSLELPSCGISAGEKVGTKDNVYLSCYRSDSGRQLYNIDVETGAIVWNTNSIGDYSNASSPTLLKDRIIVGSDKTFYAFNLVDGTKLWNYQVEGLVYGGSAITQNGNIVVTWSHYPSPYDVKMTVLNRQGEKIIETTIGSYGNQLAAPIVLKNTVFFATPLGHLKAYDTLTGNLLWDYGEFDSGGAMVTPMYYDGRITVVGHNGHVKQWIVTE